MTLFSEGTKLTKFYWIADSSTTALRIPTLFTEGYSARRRLPNGIRAVPMASEPRISLTPVVGVLSSILAEFYLMVDYSTTAA